MSGYSLLGAVHPSALTTPVVVLRHHDPSDRCVLLDVMGDMATAAAKFPMDTDLLTRTATDVCEGICAPVDMNDAGLPKAAQQASPLLLSDGCSMSLCHGSANHDSKLSAAHVVAHRLAVEAEALWCACVEFMVSWNLEDRGREAACGMLGQRSGSVVTGVYCTRKAPMASGSAPIDDGLPRGCTKSTFSFGLITRAHENDPALSLWVDEWAAHLRMRLGEFHADARQAQMVLSAALAARPVSVSKWKCAREQRKLQQASVLGVMGRGEATKQSVGLQSLAAALRCIVGPVRPCAVLASLPVPFCSGAHSDRLTMFWEPRDGRVVANEALSPVSLIYTSALNTPYFGGSCAGSLADVGVFAGGSRDHPHYSEVYRCARIGLLRPVDERVGGSSIYEFAACPVLGGETRRAIGEEGRALRASLMGPQCHLDVREKSAGEGLPSRATTVGHTDMSSSPGRGGSSASPDPSGRGESPTVQILHTPRGATLSSLTHSPALSERSELGSAEADHHGQCIPPLACSPPGRSRRLSSPVPFPHTARYSPAQPLSEPPFDAPEAGKLQWRAVKPATRKLTFTGLTLHSGGRHVMAGYMAPSFLYEPFVAPLSVHLPMFVVGDAI